MTLDERLDESASTREKHFNVDGTTGSRGNAEGDIDIQPSTNTVDGVRERGNSHSSSIQNAERKRQTSQTTAMFY